MPGQSSAKALSCYFFLLFKYRLPTRSSVSSPPSFSFPFLPASPPIEWLSDKACDYIDLVQGQTPSPPVCLSLCPFTFHFPSWSHCLSFAFLFLDISCPCFVFFPSPLSFHFEKKKRKKCHPAGRRGSTDVTVGGCVNTCKQGRKERHPLFGISWNHQSL